MAEIQEQMKPKEREIPVFTVLKNNCILKNIFLLDKPPSISSSVAQESEIEEILVVGRHPDCNIKLEHPSISRFHLRIHSKPSSRSLFVTDLSSVHGTWVSGKRLEPRVRVELNEGDTLHLGASSRMYRLNWVPLSRAYDINDPFVPQLDDTVDDETDGATDQDQDKMSPIAPPMPEDLYHDDHPFCNENEVEDSGLPEIYGKENEFSSSQLCQMDTSVTFDEETEGTTDQDSGNDKEQGLILHHSFAENDVIENNESSEVCNKENSTSQAQMQTVSQAENSVLSIWSRRGKRKSCVKIETSQSKGNSARINTSSHVELLLDGDCLNESMLKDQYKSSDEIYTPDKENTTPNSYLVQSLKSKFEETLKAESFSNSPISNVDRDEEIFTPDKENVTPNSHLFKSMKNIRKSGEVKNPKSYRPSPLKNIESSEVCNKENSTSQAQIQTVSQAENSDEMSVLSIWSRRGEPKSGVKVETSQSSVRINTSSHVESLLDGDCLNELMQKDQCESSDEIHTPDKENTTPNSYLVRSLKSNFEETLKVESFSNSPISNVDQDEEIFTPNKENVTPNSHLFKSRKNARKSGEVKHPKSYRPSPLKVANNSNNYQELNSTFPISKSHGGLKKKQSVYKARPDREPFIPLLVNSASDLKAKSHTNTMKVNENKWTIIADTTSLLNRKSRKELQLLRGLRGTTLVIPRIVIRELDCMLKRASFFSRLTEASAALNWIEECMAATKWWIHVQSSAEESTLVPPTPPAAASPRWFSEDKSVFSVGSIPFSPYSLQEIVTPTAADHILECALLFRRIRDGQLVLLSDDVALKIKAMAEGVICETAEEFRRSVVNPFSQRSLYSDSSPIGPTWSFADDMVLKENYYPSLSKKTGDGAKGLKLILLHNSNFRQLTN